MTTDRTAQPAPAGLSGDFASTSPDHGKISFTAKLVALGRSYTDIPFAPDVSELVGAPRVAAALGSSAGPELEDFAWLAPLVEARYKSIVAAIKRSGINQVLEFASGVSLRGLAMVQQDPDLTYVESDLSALTLEKLSILETIRNRYSLRPARNHHIRIANILAWDEIERALAPLDADRPVIIVHEGLFMYLSRAEKDAAAANVKRVLARHGGIWITPDFSPLSQSGWDLTDNPAFGQMLSAIEAQTGRSFAAASFADERDVAAFVAQHGFEATMHAQIDGSYELSSLAASGITAEAQARLGTALKIWEMRLRG